MDLLAGQSVGAVREIKPAGEIVRELVEDPPDEEIPAHLSCSQNAPVHEAGPSRQGRGR